MIEGDTCLEQRAGYDSGPGSMSGLWESRLTAAGMCMAPKCNFHHNDENL